MPFPKPAVPTPTAIGRIAIELVDQPAEGDREAYRKFVYHLTRLTASGGRVDTLDGDLTPHLTAPQLTALNNFLDAMRTKASEALP